MSLDIQAFLGLVAVSHIACVSTGGHTGASHANSNQDVSWSPYWDWWRCGSRRHDGSDVIWWMVHSWIPESRDLLRNLSLRSCNL